jgi:hypothetical protein
MAKKRGRPKKKKSKKPTAEKPLKVTPYPTAGKKVKDFEDRLDEQLAGGEPKTRPGDKKEPDHIASDIINIDLRNLIKMPFELWAISQDVKELALTDREAAQIAEPVKHLLDYYLPQIPAIAYAWIALTVNGFWIMRTRLLLIAEIKERKKESDGKRGGAGPAPEPVPPGPVPPGQGGNQKFPSEIKTQKIDG